MTTRVKYGKLVGTVVQWNHNKGLFTIHWDNKSRSYATSDYVQRWADNYERSATEAVAALPEHQHESIVVAGRDEISKVRHRQSEAIRSVTGRVEGFMSISWEKAQTWKESVWDIRDPYERSKQMESDRRAFLDSLRDLRDHLNGMGL